MSSGSKALALLLIAIALIGGGYRWGDSARNNTWLAKQAKEQKQQQAKYQAEVDRGDQAVKTYLQDHRDQEDRYAQLDDDFKAFRKRTPLTVPARVAVGVPANATDAAGPVAPIGRIELHLPADAVPALTLGAVWMWNSALLGKDTAAGACGAAAAGGETEAACAEEAGLTVDDAWDNHTENARSCARDRQRLTNLIEYLKGRKNE